MRLILALSLSLLLAATADSAVAQTEAEIQQEYLSFLDAKGLDAELDSDGDVKFIHSWQRQKLQLFLFVNEDDPTFFRLVVPRLWEIGSDAERRQVLEAVDGVTADLKVVKAFTVEDNVWISVELFLPEWRSYEAVFDRSLALIDDALGQFIVRMNADG